MQCPRSELPLGFPWIRVTVAAVLAASVLVACGAPPPEQPPADGGETDGGEADAGRPDAGRPDAGRGLADVFAHGALSTELRPRVSGAGIRLVRRGETSYVLEVSRDEAGREARRLVARSGGAEQWARTEAPGERLADFTVHPSGELTLGLERRAAASDAFDLVRLDPGGAELRRQVLARPSTLPPGDLAASLPPSPFLMKGVLDSSTIRGWLPWLRLEARGEGLAVGLLSYVDVPAGPSDTNAISAVLALDWEQGRYVERWARAVDGAHALIAVAWQYDEFLWLDAATRLLVAVDADGTVFVGRTLSATRCTAVVERFGEVGAARCRELRDGTPHRNQPFAFTVFSKTGERLGTRVLFPPGHDDFLVFDLAVRGGKVAVAGAAVRLSTTGGPDYYFEPPGDTAGTPLLPFDGYLAVLDGATGAVQHERYVDLGRADLLAAVRWTQGGLLAAGASDWNRWYGGMSVSRGAEPLLVLDPLDGGAPLTRTFAVADDTRHAHLLALDTDGERVWAAGPYDAPMTHSGDLAVAPMALGGLGLELR